MDDPIQRSVHAHHGAVTVNVDAQSGDDYNSASLGGYSPWALASAIILTLCCASTIGFFVGWRVVLWKQRHAHGQYKRETNETHYLFLQPLPRRVRQ